jgi:hypothetical protein
VGASPTLSGQSADYVVLKRNLNGHGGRVGLPQIRFRSIIPEKIRTNHAFYVPKVTGKRT